MSNDAPPANSIRRCPYCDSVVARTASRCSICGKEIEPEIEEKPEIEIEEYLEIEEPVSVEVEVAPEIEEEPKIEIEEEESAGILAEPEIILPKETDPQAPVPDPIPRTADPAPPPPRSPFPDPVFILTAVFTMFMLVISVLILRYQEPVQDLGLFPTLTPIPPTITFTPTWTAVPSQTPSPTTVPTVTPTPMPPPTLQPPRPHRVSSGETMIGLASRYRVSMDSIISQNGLASDSHIQVGQELQIPWPTATPPLVKIGIEINGELVIADPTNCQRYEVLSGDSLAVISAKYDVDFDLLVQVNRLENDVLLQPGDTVCIPTILYGETLPPTPGPSPTPLPTAPPAGPDLLYPVADAVIDPPDGRVMLQWVGIKNLSEREWYMVEMSDLDQIDRLPRRAFTRDTMHRLPASWRPDVNESHHIRWQVSIVTVTEWRADGLPIYTYGGEMSDPSFFEWLGAVPTATPLPTATAVMVTAVPNK